MPKDGELVESAKRRAMEPPIELQITDGDGRNLYDVEIREDGKAYDLGYDLSLREAKFPIRVAISDSFGHGSDYLLGPRVVQ